MKTLKRILSLVPACLLWLLLGLVLWGAVFSRLTDAPAAQKVTLVTDLPAVHDAELSVYLTEEKPEGIRMVTVHPIAYYLVRPDEAEWADLFLLRRSEAEGKRELFVPLAALGLDTAGALCLDGTAYGIPAYDAATGRGIAADYFHYELQEGEREDCYLFFGVHSGHLGAALDCPDDAALAVAETLLRMTAAPVSAAAPVTSDSLSVKAVEGLPEDFMMGMDVSSLIALEDSGVKYYGFDGEERDPLRTLADCGITHLRVRVWNDPYDTEGHGFGGGNCDVEKAAALGERAARYGLKLIVDFHYSDFWADPGKQKAPRAWADMDLGEKADALYRFTLDSLDRIQAAGGEIAMAQLGNETNGALCGETEWDSICRLMAAGSRAVRERCPGALVAVHFTNPERAGAYRSYARTLEDYDLDYDVFASSYYPYWHGSLENLTAVLGEVAERFGKRVMVMETSYAYTLEDTDFFGNTVGAGSGLPLPWPCTVQGQADAVREVIDAVHRCGGLGVCYWEGAWISVGRSSWEANRALWETFGSGWASSYAAAYDPEDAGRWYGGCAVDNQAMFDVSGRPLESLKVFALVR